MREIAVVCNGKAGSVKERVVHEFGEKFTTFAPRCLEELAENAQEIQEGSFGAVYSVGGDGTFYRVINALASCGDIPPMGIVKAGTGNALAHLLGSKKGVKQLCAVREMEELPLLRVPLISVEADGEKKGYTTLGGTGLDARILNDYNSVGWNGMAGYLRAVFTKTIPQCLFGDVSQEVSLSWEGATSLQGKALPEKVEKTLAVATGITEFYGFGLKGFPLAKEARKEERMQVRVVHGNFLKVSSRMVFGIYGVFKGTHTGDHVDDFLASGLEVSYGKPEPFQLMGDALGYVSSVKYKMENEVHLIQNL